MIQPHPFTCPEKGIKRRAILACAGATLAGFAVRAAAKDDGISVQTLTIAKQTGLTGLLAEPNGAGKRAAIVVMHDLQGLSAHVKNITHRLARAGYTALAVDCASVRGSASPVDFRTFSIVDTVAVMQSAVAVLRARPQYAGKVGAVGFGWGGTAINHLALADPTLAAVVSYYGQQPLYYLEDEYRRFTAAMLHHYAGRDTVNNQGIDNFRVNLSDVGKNLESYIYPNVNRGFDDESAATYDAAAAALAWTRSAAFLKKHLG
ncbi:MAG: dienelactone hydrolase family protein [Rhodospirillaceae bacterium]|nr:dienelactone hydrolase family protein [Rhodospirillaceae bacterium]